MDNIACYAAVNCDFEIRKNSSSGGVFSAIAEMFDVVYGAAMTEDCYGVEMIRVEGDITRLRGSKYLQAKMGNILKQVKEDLELGKNVLFSGTGCQINGLKHFLGNNYSNLTCVDVICHGVPSPRLWKEYATFQESKFGKLESVFFRCKDNGYGNFGMKENQLFIPKDKDIFMQMFLRNYCLRPACYECHAKYYKNSDMTIADFWGIENIAPELNDDMGTSLIITRTEKGQALFESVQHVLRWKVVEYADAVENNHSEYKSVDRPTERDSFFIDLSQLSIEEMERKYAAEIKVSPIRKLARKVKWCVKKALLFLSEETHVKKYGGGRGRIVYIWRYKKRR